MGFALLAVLWVVTLMAGLSAVTLAVARDAVAASRNRTNLMAAAWEAEGCAERARAEIDGILAHAVGVPARTPAWRLVDTIVAGVRLPERCRVSARAAGSALDVNTATPAALAQVVRAAGLAPEFADSFAVAVVDWRDTDTVARRAGAEASWYRTRGWRSPRNGSFVHRDEVLLVRGGDRLGSVAALLDVEPGLLAIDHIPEALAAALPGFTLELGALIRDRQGRRDRSGTLLELGARLSQWSRDSLQTRFADLSAIATLDPDAWVLESSAWAGEPPIEAVVELRLERAGTRAAVVRRRVWP